ncbi:MAG: hypothetical protein WD801_12000, partial [Gemmatimonadaceae bacterium]
MAVRPEEPPVLLEPDGPARPRKEPQPGAATPVELLTGGGVAPRAWAAPLEAQMPVAPGEAASQADAGPEAPESGAP